MKALSFNEMTVAWLQGVKEGNESDISLFFSNEEPLNNGSSEPLIEYVNGFDIGEESESSKQNL